MTRHAVGVWIVLLLALIGLWRHGTPEWSFAATPLPDAARAAEFETVFEYQSPEGTAHAPAFALSEEALRVMWFDGIRESHNDVRILGVDIADGQAGAVFELLTRQSVSAAMHPGQVVLTLGNTISFDGGPDRLLSTIVSLGGWAASSVADVQFGSGGVDIARRLDMSPLLGRSHLVKSPTLAMSGNMYLLPSYFEMGRAFGEVALLDHDARVRGLARIPGNWDGIQPMIVPMNEKDAVAVLRNFDHGSDRLLISRTANGGRSWSALSPLDLPNPSAPVAMVGLGGQQLLMAFNDDTERADTLTLAVSKDFGKSWKRTRVLGERGGGDLRYPMMAALNDGRIALTYSNGTKSGIVVHIFSTAWAIGP